MVTCAMTRRRAGLLGAAALLAVAAFPSDAAAETWPTRTVRIIVPYPAGGSTDLLARILAKLFTEKLGQPFAVDNRAGANGNLGAAAVAAAKPDGYTLLFTTNGPLVVNKIIYKEAAFDPARDFAPIVEVAAVPLMIAVNKTVPVKTLPELVAYARQAPGKLTYSTGGIGTMGHLTAELVQRDLGIQLTHVPYTGSAPALTALLSGAVNLSFDLIPTYAEYVRSGRIDALAVTTSRPATLLPAVATLAEQGMAGFDATGWMAMAGPAGLGADIVQKLNQVVNQYVAGDDGRAALAKLGMEPLGGTPAQLGAFMASELEKWRPVAERVAAQ